MAHECEAKKWQARVKAMLLLRNELSLVARRELCHQDDGGKEYCWVFNDESTLYEKDGSMRSQEQFRARVKKAVKSAAAGSK